MALDVSATIVIDRTADAVARYAFDPTNDPEWIGGVDSVERRPDGAGSAPGGTTAVGSRVLRRGRFMGRDLEWLMEVVKLVPDRMIDLHALKSPFPMDVSYALEPHGADGRSTRVTLRVRGEARGFYALPGPLLGPMVRRSIEADAKRLKDRVESVVLSPG